MKSLTYLFGIFDVETHFIQRPYCLDLISRLDKKIDPTFLDPPFNQDKEYEKISYHIVIHIALIGRKTAHIWPGLKEIIPAEKLYLLHRPNTERDKFADMQEISKKK